MEYFHSIKVPNQPASPAAWCWSKSCQVQPLLAVATAGAAVGIYTTQGLPWGPAKGTVRNVRGTEASCLTWHPRLALLAIAWRDGAISIWDALQQHLEEDSKVHRHPVHQLAWHVDGHHLLTADTQGKVAIWEVNKLHQPVHKCAVAEKSGTVSQAIWNGRQLLSPAVSQDDPVAYYAVGSADNNTVTIKWLNKSGQTGVVKDTGEGLQALLHYADTKQLIAVSTSGSAAVYESSVNTGKAGITAADWGVVMKMKFAGAADGSKVQVCWAGPHTLATAADSDGSIRLLQLDTGDNYMLDLKDARFIRSDSDTQAISASANAAEGLKSGVTCLAYEPMTNLLAAGTSDGQVYTFRRGGNSAADSLATEPAKQWEPQNRFLVNPGMIMLGWGPGGQVLGALCRDGLFSCTKCVLRHKLSEGYAVIQVATSQVLLERMIGPPKPVARVTSSMQLTGMDVTNGALLLHNGQQAEVHKINEADNTTSLLARFEGSDVPALGGGAAGGPPAGLPAVRISSAAISCSAMALHRDSVYRVAERRVEVCNLSGVVKQTLSFDESHGQPVLLNTHNEHLAVLTLKGLVLVYKLAGREAKPHAGPGFLVASGSTQGMQVESIRLNCNGSMVAAVGSIAGSGGQRDSRIFIYSAELNGPIMYDFAGDGRAPFAAHWDLQDPRLLAVQTCPLAPSADGSSSSNGADTSTADDDADFAVGDRTSSIGALPCNLLDVAVLFATAEAGVLLQEYQDLKQLGASGFLGVCAPNLLVHKKTFISSPGAPPYSSYITKVALQSFSGLDNADEPTRKALLDFNYQLAVGKLDEAFRAVAALKSPAMWRSMAHMAIKNKRLDVAEQCLGNMQHVQGARAVRESASEPELDARVGLVAVQLGLKEDAARLFASCERWDLLEQLHQATGNWDEALQVAQAHDRINLKTVHFKYAQHLESLGKLADAARHYVESGTASTELPRMMWQHGDLEGLERHVLQSTEPALLTWWAQYCESNGKFDQALSCYKRAGNQLAALRIYCAIGDWQAAEGLVADSQHPAAAFHLARLYEAHEKVADALRCFTISKRYSHGARLAKRYGMDQELLSMALKSSPDVMVEAADHLLTTGNAEAAALLYQKGGKLGKALEMALSSGLYEVLDSIAEQLNQDSDPVLMARCGEAFLAAGHHDKAVRLLVRAHQPQRALDLLVEHQVPLTEELAEALTPEKTPDNTDSRAAILMRIAQAAKHQGLFHLACKKYTQAGDRLKAMRALVKSGDTEKIVFFAGVSRQRDVYIMAANFLQTLDWRSNAEYLKHILNFYTKAGAADSLAHFYGHCAQVEIDEFNNYAKALQALEEAAKHLAKSRASDRELQLAALGARVGRITRFTSAQAALDSDPAVAVATCQQLLQELQGSRQDAAADVRAGDVYAVLVQWCCQQHNMSQALQLLQQMQERGLHVQHYLGHVLVAEIYQGNGLQVPTEGQTLQQQAQQQIAKQGSCDLDEVQEELPSMDD